MNILWEDLVLETLPFRQEIVEWCKHHPEFKKALKALASERFLHLGVVIVTHPPETKDEVLGIFAYDYKNNPPLFKQDFIVDEESLHKKFVLYTGFPRGMQSSKYVKNISEFFLKYGKNGNYANQHHLTFEQLPEDKELRERATRMMWRSKNLPEKILEIPPKMAEDFMASIKELKKGKYMEFRKIKK